MLEHQAEGVPQLDSEESTSQQLAESAPAEADSRTNVTDSVSSASATADDNRSGEEILAEGLIPPDSGASTAATSVDATPAQEDEAASAADELLPEDGVEAPKVQMVDSADVQSGSTTETADSADLESSTGALIQVRLILGMIPACLLRACALVCMFSIPTLHAGRTQASTQKARCRLLYRS